MPMRDGTHRTNAARHGQPAANTRRVAERPSRSVGGAVTRVSTHGGGVLHFFPAEARHAADLGTLVAHGRLSAAAQLMVPLVVSRVVWQLKMQRRQFRRH